MCKEKTGLLTKSVRFFQDETPEKGGHIERIFKVYPGNAFSRGI